MMIYNIINPSDTYTIETNSFELACVCTAILGNGAYPLESIDGKQQMPLLMLVLGDAWFYEMFGKSFKDCLAGFSSNELADCFDSIVIGDRDIYTNTLELIKDEHKKEWIEKWNNDNRSSLNNIGEVARNYAKELRKVNDE